MCTVISGSFPGLHVSLSVSVCTGGAVGVYGYLLAGS